MIRAMIFDLAGTLVQTERLKARSYAHAAIELCPHNLGEAEVREAFKQVVGRPRREVAMALTKRFGLEDAARARMREFGVSAPWPGVPPGAAALLRGDDGRPGGAAQQAMAAQRRTVAGGPEERLLDELWIGDDPSTLTAVVRQMVEERKQD